MDDSEMLMLYASLAQILGLILAAPVTSDEIRRAIYDFLGELRDFAPLPTIREIESAEMRAALPLLLKRLEKNGNGLQKDGHEYFSQDLDKSGRENQIRVLLQDHRERSDGGPERLRSR